MNIRRLDHVAIHVRDVDASSKFYREVLRLEPLPRPAFTFPGAWFRLGDDQELHLIGDRAQAVHSSNRGNHFALRDRSGHRRFLASRGWLICATPADPVTAASAAIAL